MKDVFLENWLHANYVGSGEHWGLRDRSRLRHDLHLRPECDVAEDVLAEPLEYAREWMRLILGLIDQGVASDQYGVLLRFALLRAGIGRSAQANGNHAIADSLQVIRLVTGSETTWRLWR